MPRAFLIRRRNILKAITDSKIDGESQAEYHLNKTPSKPIENGNMDSYNASSDFYEQSYAIHTFSKINPSNDIITAMAENRKNVFDYLRYIPHLQNGFFRDEHWQSKTLKYEDGDNKYHGNHNTYLENISNITYDTSNNYDHRNDTRQSQKVTKNNKNNSSKDESAPNTIFEGRLYAASAAQSRTEAIQGTERPFVCSICGKCFRLSSTLCRHKIIHTSQRPHKCTICSKSFNRSSTLKTHMRTHSKTKEFCCSICNKGFHQKGNLRNHILIHTGEKPYACTYCSKAFNKLSNLKFHMHTHTDQQPYRCRFCKASMARRGELKQHILEQHPMERATEVQVMEN